MGKRFFILTATIMLLTGAALYDTALTTPQDAAEKKVKAVGDSEKGMATYKMMCVTCHGDLGKGDGAAAVALDPKPRDLSDAKYMANLTNDYLIKVLKGGGTAVGKSAMMPALGAAMTEAQLTNVIAYLRNLSAKPTKTADKKTEPTDKADAGS